MKTGMSVFHPNQLAPGEAWTGTPGMEREPFPTRNSWDWNSRAAH